MSLGLVAAFGAGILSLLSPCVIALVPGYLCYLTGTSLKEAQTDPTTRWRVTLHAFWFVVGVTLLFMALGAVVSLSGSVLSAYQSVLERVGGLVLILFGIALTGLITIPWLSRDYRVQFKPGRSAWWRVVLMGMTFGASWSQCTGPMLGSILVLAAVKSSLVQGVSLMLAFALGQGVPLLLAGILVDRVGTLIRRVQPFTARLSSVGGATMVLIGVFLVAGLFNS